MGEIRILKCDVENCKERTEEVSEGAGFPGWGHVEGIANVLDGKMISTRAYICPLHLLRIKEFLNGKEVK